MMRSSTAASIVFVLVLFPGVAFAQSQPSSQDPQQTEQKAQQTEQKPPKKDQPPAAVGEAGKKPVRSFPSALVHNLGDDLKHMPRRNSVYWLAGGSAIALAIHPEDRKINGHLATHSRFETDLWRPGSVIGEGYVIGPAAVATYLVGRWDHSPRVMHLGMDEIEGAILATGFAEGIKEIARRPRPRPNINQPIIATGYSFPSGHATLTFEAATILQQHLGYKAGIPTYLIATYVAMSRLHDNVHFASDVAFGAGLGILIGRSVTWHGRNFWGYNMSITPTVVPGGGGVAVAFHAAPPVPNR